MRYDNSLTSNVNDYITNKLAKKIQEAQSCWDLNNAARDIRSYLCDYRSLCTPDFVIRRFLQAKQSSILPTDVDIPNLLTKKDATNLPWPEDVIDLLSSRLAKQSKEKGTNLEKKTWFDYLSGKRNPQNREMVYRIAFTLDMDIDTTIDLLLASDLEPHSARYPLDLICLFCQRVPGKYTWDEVQGMLDAFSQKGTEGYIGEFTPTEGKTLQISSTLDAIFKTNQGDADAKEALIKNMVSNASEFPCYKKTVTRVCRGADGKPIKGKKESKVVPHYLEGFSLSRMKCFMRLAEYLGVLLPYYSWGKEKEPGEKTIDRDLKDWGPDGQIIVPLDFEDNGMPKLQSLVKCMFFNCELTDIFPKDDYKKKEKKKETDTGEEKKEPSLSPDEALSDNMRILLQNYEAHMTAVSKLREYLDNTNKEVAINENREKDDFVEFFRRQDALFFVYFFIVGYRNLLALINNLDTRDEKVPYTPKDKLSCKYIPSPSERLNFINSMCMSGAPFDDAILEVLNNLDRVFSDSDDADAVAERFDYLKDCFNIILAQMDYMNLYLPARFDRFVMLSLLAEDPTELTPLIMCHTQLDDYERYSQDK